MANENKNFNELVTEDDDPTVELETLADTCGIARKPVEDPSITELQSDLQVRSETIERLQYDIEHLRNRWTGLEKEIEAREALTLDLNKKLAQIEKDRSEKDKLLRKRDDSIKALKAEIRERNVEYTALRTAFDKQEQELELLREDLASRPSPDSIPDEIELARQAGRLTAAESELAELKTQLSRTEAYADDIRHQLQDRSAVIDEALETRDKLRASLGDSDARAESLQRDLDELNAANAALSRELATRTEQFDSDIRVVRTELDEALEANRDLRAGLDDSNAELEQLRADLDELQTAHAGLSEEMTSLRDAHAREIRTLRFELGEAQDTVAEKELVAEQLASDLVNTRGRRDLLEKQLTESEDVNGTRIENLERQIRRLQEDLAHSEEERESKSDAVNCLLAELAKKTKQLESIGQIEDVIHEIGDRMSERFEDRGNRDRVSRVLIGEVDGQELRFPLFKNRLTIGRTEQNDIQLKANYVSRRHAVVVTDNDMTRIVDWGSKNGVFVNSERVTEHFLQNGDQLRIGTALFRYEERHKRDA